LKEKIHPKWFQATVVCACGNTFVTGSTLEKLHVEICSACHPFFTGKQKFVDTEGRVEKFITKYGTVTSKRSKKAAAPAAAAPAAAAPAAAAPAAAAPTAAASPTTAPAAKPKAAKVQTNTKVTPEAKSKATPEAKPKRVRSKSAKAPAAADEATAKA